MSEVMLNIMDKDCAIHGEIHGSIADSVVAALSAEPETIEELEAAVARFIKPTGEGGLFEFFSRGICEQPWDAGIVFVDLAAKVVAGESTYSSLQKRGKVQYHDGSAATDVWVNYQVPDDWLFVRHIDGWQALAQRRRDEWLNAPPLDARKVIYGKVAEFIVRECSLCSRTPSAYRFSAAEDTPEDPIADIHARWLMTPRGDLRGQSPRELLLAKLEFIDLDLQWRANQWTFVGECPPGLSTESSAYRFGGFGRHENVLYYDLVRYLLESCWHRVSQERNIAIESEIERLRQLKEDWLHTPQNDLHGMSPLDVIKHERMRLPVALSAEQIVIDDDCPLCRMLAEEDNPTFWHLDGCNMDYDFPFSFYQTREEWEEEQRRWEEFNREWEEQLANLAPGSSPTRREETEEDELRLYPSIWQRSYVNWDELETLPPESAIEIMLFGIGGHLAELGSDLEDAPEGEELAQSLRSDFADLRHALRADSEELVEDCLQKLREDLAEIATATPQLVDKCVDLQSQLDNLGNLC